MAKREVKVEIRAKSVMRAELSKAGAALQKFGKSAMRIGSFFAKGFLAAGAALAGFAAKAINSYAGLERETNALSNTLDSYGESGKQVVPVLRAQAKALQDATGQTEAQTFAVMNQLKMYGVQTDQLANATKGVLALNRAGMKGEAATKAMAAATMGNFEALTRYIPQLRVATDEADKMRIVNEFLARGYEAQQGELDTVSGQWANLKGRVGDVWEAIGAAIAQNDTLVDVLKRASDAVKAFGDRVTEWAGEGGVANVIATAQHFFEILRHGFMRVSNSAHRAFAGIGDVSESVLNYLGNIATKYAKLMISQWVGVKDVAVATFNAIRRPSREAFRAVGEAAKKAAKDAKDAAIEMARAFADGSQITTRRTDEATAARAAIERDHVARVEAINAAHTTRLMGETKKRVEAEKDAIGDVIDASALAAKKREELEKHQADIEKQIADARKREAQERIAALNEEAARRAEIAAMTVKQYIDEQREAEKAAKAEERREKRDAKRMEQIKRKQDLGVRLTGADRKFMEARQAIEAARMAPAELKAAEKELQEMQAQTKTLDDLLREQRTVNTNLQRLLATG